MLISTGLWLEWQPPCRLGHSREHDYVLHWKARVKVNRSQRPEIKATTVQALENQGSLPQLSLSMSNAIQANPVFSILVSYDTT